MADFCAKYQPLVHKSIMHRLPEGIMLVKELEDKMKTQAKEGYGLRNAYTILIKDGYVKTVLARLRDEAIRKRKEFTENDRIFIRSYIVPILEKLTDVKCGINTNLIINEVKMTLKFNDEMIHQIKNGTKNAYNCHISNTNFVKNALQSNQAQISQSISSMTKANTINLTLSENENTKIMYQSKQYILNTLPYFRSYYSTN